MNVHAAYMTYITVVHLSFHLTGAPCSPTRPFPTNTSCVVWIDRLRRPTLLVKVTKRPMKVKKQASWTQSPPVTT
jgi:hypothetical protein